MKIFVSYRRDDSAYQTGRLCDRLVAQFGEEGIFKDVDSMPVGRDFRQVIHDEVSRSDIMLAVIGEGWLGARDSSGRRRLDDPADFVRLEIGYALSRGIPVVPLLFGKADLPKPEELPDELRELVFRHGVRIQPDPNFHPDVDRLIESLLSVSEPGIPKTFAASPATGQAGKGSSPRAERTRSPTRIGPAPRVRRFTLASGLLIAVVMGAFIVALVHFKLIAMRPLPAVPNAIKFITLNIALESHGGIVIEDYLKIYEDELRPVYKDVGIDFHITIHRKNEDEYDIARNEFKREGYDIVMLDDPWMPEYAPLLEDLEALGLSKQLGDGVSVDSLFAQPLIDVCRPPQPGSKPRRLLALPVTGNVQLMLIRNDLLDQAGGLLSARVSDPLLSLPYPINESVERASELKKLLGIRRPVALRYDSPNSTTEDFWELLRAQGYEESYTVTGDVIVPRQMADTAMAWIRHAQTDPHNGQGDAEEATAGLMKGESLMIFGWPNWIIPFLKSDQAGKVGVIQISPHPVLGTWVLAIPRTSSQKEYALRLLVRLTSTTTVQERLAKDGIVPVLKSIGNANVGKNAFWANNFEKIKAAQERSRPRPRMPNWSSVEDVVGRQVLDGLADRNVSPFRSVPGKIRFEP